VTEIVDEPNDGLMFVATSAWETAHVVPLLSGTGEHDPPLSQTGRRLIVGLT
jgi:hypothetical protein